MPDNEMGRKILARVYDVLAIPDPMAELEKDTRGRLRKFLRPKNRKSSTVTREFDSYGTKSNISAIRTYDKEKDTYYLRVYGGKAETDLN